jgi:glutamine synthetase
MGNLPEAFEVYLGERRLDEVECIVPDLAGMSRGKTMPSHKFDPDQALFLPVSLFYQTISGEWVDMEIQNQWLESDIVLRPDLDTACAVPWSEDASVQIIHDLETRDGQPLGIAPRNVLKRVLSFYKEKGWQPIVAPELEFYLTKPNDAPNEEIEPPIGRTGRRGSSRQAYSMVAVDEFGDVIDTIYDFAEAQGLTIDSVIQESGAGQIEINLNHGDPLRLADEVFYFKRSIREAALKNGVFATFMAKPIRDEPGSAMHLHQSVVDIKTGQNIFSTPSGEASQAFYDFIGGSQKYLMEVVPFLLPYVNSYRRISIEGYAAPANLEWASDNRTTGLRVPISGPAARRVEHRVIGSDTNPYLSIAASLAAGYLGMVNGVAARPEVSTNAYGHPGADQLPFSLRASLEKMEDAEAMPEILGKEFWQLYTDIKNAELDEHQREISPWERQHLLLNV